MVLQSLAELQLLYDVTFINCGAEQDVAHTILRMNKAIAEAPVKYVLSFLNFNSIDDFVEPKVDFHFFALALFVNGPCWLSW